MSYFPYICGTKDKQKKIKKQGQRKACSIPSPKNLTW